MEICSMHCGFTTSLSYEDHQFTIEVTWGGDFPANLDTDKLAGFEWATFEIGDPREKSTLAIKELDEVSVFDAIDLLEKLNLISWDCPALFTKNINKFLNLCCK